uniref:Uncharacterized protein n=1 Tax=Arundo donax TaxID=35708 RepID=A0A0A8YWX9_ARUDO
MGQCYETGAAYLKNWSSSHAYVLIHFRAPAFLKCFHPLQLEE